MTSKIINDVYYIYLTTDKFYFNEPVLADPFILVTATYLNQIEITAMP